MMSFELRTTDLKNAVRNTEIIKLTGVTVTEVKETKCRGVRALAITFRGHLYQILQARKMAQCLEHAYNCN